MEDFPTPFSSTPVPLVALFGLPPENPHVQELERAYPLLQEKGVYVSSDIPNVSGQTADQVSRGFDNLDAVKQTALLRVSALQPGGLAFAFRRVGRSFTFPARKADSALQSESSSLSDLTRRSSSAATAHSPLSPLTHDSPLYPDGLMSTLWLSKYQQLVPSIFLALFDFTLDQNRSTLSDNKLKTEINALRVVLSASGFKTRLVVALLCLEDGPDEFVGERVGVIRRGTNLDTKSVFVLGPESSQAACNSFVAGILQTIQPVSHEFYRDLGKRTRKKKGKGSSFAGLQFTQSPLSYQGWTIRYAAKQGIFAETRADFDAAEQSYQTAYEQLFNGDLLNISKTPHSRALENRMLADTLALHILRCLLYLDQTTAAARFFQIHSGRTKLLLEKNGKKLDNYAFYAWETRWAKIMAQTLEQVSLPLFDPVAGQQPRLPEIFAVPEKAFANQERLLPWDLLHHGGFWYQLVSRLAKQRRQATLTMPEEDRKPPATDEDATRVTKYDDYMNLAPDLEYGKDGSFGHDHLQEIGKALNHARIAFDSRQQIRAAEHTLLEIGREYVKASQWDHAFSTLKPLWQTLTWRKSGWWELLHEVIWLVRACARHLEQGDLLISIEWELLSNAFIARQDWRYDLTKCLEGIDLENRPHAIIASDTLAPTFSAQLLFFRNSVMIGQPVKAYLILSSHTHSTSPPISLAEVHVLFESAFQNILITNDEAREYTKFDQLNLDETVVTEGVDTPHIAALKDKTLSGASNLVFESGQTKVWTMTLIPKAIGETLANRILLSLRYPSFDLDLTMDLKAAETHEVIGQDSSFEDLCQTIAVIPKPPKLEVELHDIDVAYFLGEIMPLTVRIVNREEDAVNMTIKINMISDRDDPALIFEPSSELSQWNSTLIKVVDDDLEAAETLDILLQLQAPKSMLDAVLEIRVEYFIVSDTETPLLQSLTQDVAFVRPFEANYKFKPVINNLDWPNYFSTPDNDGETDDRLGLIHDWNVSAIIASFAHHDLLIEDVRLQILQQPTNATAKLVSHDNDLHGEETIAPKTQLGRDFTVSLSKPDVDEEEPVNLELALEIDWRRTNADSQTVSAILIVTPLQDLYSEPRVLARASITELSAPLVNLTCALENASLYMLTFNVTLEASEDFAFSGTKSRTVNVLPKSRMFFEFVLFPTTNVEILRPVLKVVDVGFGKTLDVIPTTGCDADERGLLVYLAPQPSP